MVGKQGWKSQVVKEMKQSLLEKLSKPEEGWRCNLFKVEKLHYTQAMINWVRNGEVWDWERVGYWKEEREEGEEGLNGKWGVMKGERRRMWWALVGEAPSSLLAVFYYPPLSWCWGLLSLPFLSPRIIRGSHTPSIHGLPPHTTNM